MIRTAALAFLGLIAAACTSTTRASQSIQLPEANVAALPQVEVREIEAPHGYPPLGRYFEIHNQSDEPITIRGYGPGNYVQRWQRLEFGVWIDQGDPPNGSRMREVPLEPGSISMFRGSSTQPGDRVGLQVTQGDRTELCWSH